MSHRRSDWVLGGIGLAIGFMLFKLFAALLVLGALVVWNVTGEWTPGWRQFARFTLVAFVVFLLFAVILLFVE
jgi:hypothetical protein